MIKLQDYIDSLHSPSLSLAETIQAIADLAPGLKAEAPKEYGYFANHPDYEGIANLTSLGSLVIECGKRCQTEHAPLHVRLIHQSTDDPIFYVYDTSQGLLKEAVDDGTVTYPKGDKKAECACCRGDPDAVILMAFHERLAFTFDEEEYKSLWGDEKNSGWVCRTLPDGEVVKSLVASREQVERALKESETPTGDVTGQAEKTGA